MEKTQFENILASLELSNNDRLSLLYAAAYAHRQAAREHIGRETAKLISEALRTLYNSGRGKEEARKLIGLARWVFEASKNKYLPIKREEVKNLTFEKLLELLERS